MRPALALAVVLAGCNQIYGLDPVGVLQPDAIDAPDLPRVSLTFMVAKTQVGVRPDPTLDLPAIADASVRVGALTGELVAAPFYDTTDGTVRVPSDLPGTPWRLEYARPGAAPVEVQWKAAAEVGHFVEPVFGRLDRTIAPANSAYSLDIAGGLAPPSPFTNPHALTSGVWIDLGVSGVLMEPFTVRMDNAPPLSGPPGVPDATDTLAVVDYTPSNLCIKTIGSAEFTPMPLVGGQTVNLVAPWQTGDNRDAALAYADISPPGQILARLQAALSGRSGTVDQRELVGVLPHDKMPAFTRELAGVPAPVTLPWVDCTAATASPRTDLEAYKLPPGFANFPSIAYANARNARSTPTGATLPSSMAAATTGPSSATSFAIDFRTPFALAPILLDGVSLTTADQTAIPAATSAQVELTFEREPSDMLVVHFYEVHVFEVLGGSLQLVKIYVLADPATRSVQIDRALFVSTHEYVLAIRAVRGRPNAANGDFVTVTYPQAEATIFTNTFVAP